MMLSRAPGWALIALPLGFLSGPPAQADLEASSPPTFPPQIRGNLEKGTLTAELYRGASVPDELLVIDTPGNCENTLKVRLSWDKKQDYVRVRVTGENALDPSPSVTRTEGVDYFPNPHWPEVKDVEDGNNILWLVFVTAATEFYYDAETLDLIGSSYSVDTPPENSIPVHIPGFFAVPTAPIEVDENGDVDWVHEFSYSKMTHGFHTQFAHFFASFVPHNLCEAHPTDYTQTSSRPYAAPPVPAEEGLPFSEYLRNGLIFDVTVEPTSSNIWPPLSTNIATYSQALTVAGGVPNGFTNDIEAAFAGLAPPIRPWEGRNSCEPWFKPVRKRNFNACASAPEGGDQ